MTKTYYTQLHVTPTQAHLLEHYISGTHYLSNLYLRVQSGLLYQYQKQYPYKTTDRTKLSKEIKQQFFISAAEFEKVFNHVIRVSNRSNIEWLMDLPQKTRKQAFRDMETAFKNMFKLHTGYPHYKGRHSNRSCYFNGSIHVQRNLVQLPKIGKLQINQRDYGYIPTDDQLQKHGYHILSARISSKANRYFISIITNEPEPVKVVPLNDKTMGIDIGMKQLMTTNYQTNDHQPLVIHDITKTAYYRHLENYLHRLQRKLARRRTVGRQVTQNYIKMRKRVAKWHYKIKMFNERYIRSVTTKIIQQHPHQITLEHLNVRGIMKSHHLAPRLQKLGISKCMAWLAWLAHKQGIVVKIASQWYPSTKLCSRCHQYNQVQFQGTISDL